MTKPSIHRACAFLLLAVAAITLAASAQQPATPPLAFEVATIKPHDPQVRPNAWLLQPTPDGYDGKNISLSKLVQEAYGIFDTKLVTGGPAWINTDKFDLDAKFDAASIPDLKGLTYRQRADMLRSLLADRFHLKVHFETKDFPVYNLVLAKDGPKFQETKPEDIPQGPMGPFCVTHDQGFGNIKPHGCLVKSLADLLLYDTGRTVIDKTGLTGRYDFELHYTPENTPVDSRYAGRPDVFTALQKQLGLKLEPSTAPLSILVIDSADKPTAN